MTFSMAAWGASIGLSAVIQYVNASTNRLFLEGFELGKERARYTVEETQVPCHVSWRPEFDPFPQELSNLVARASSLLGEAHQFGGTQDVSRFEVDDIHIRRLGFASVETGGLVESEATNAQWFVAIDFHSADAIEIPVSKPIPRKHIVMLLDGTCAAEEMLTLKKSAVALRPKTQTISSPFLAASALSPNFSAVLSPNFSIPDVQWDPWGAAFPLDLRAEVKRTKQVLASSLPPGSTLVLREIDLWRYLPMAALKGTNKSVTNNLHHWEIVFSFWDDQGRALDINVLLDGRILMPN